MKRHEEKIRFRDDWLKTPLGRFIEGRKQSLIDRLLKPQAGERLLDIGCGGGHHLLFFKEKGCDITGFDSSQAMLDITHKRLDGDAETHTGKYDNLPFSDGEFDIVTIICTLDRHDFPRDVIAEAIRVCRGRIFLGIPNQISLSRGGIEHSPVLDSHLRPTSFFNILDVKYMIKSVTTRTPISWGSVIYFPLHWYTPFGQRCEEMMPVMKNPFGAFIGVGFPVVITRRTLQEPVMESPRLNMAESRHVPGAAREMKS